MIGLLDHYNKPTPRYTSYPPVPHWRDDVGAECLMSALEASVRPLSIYIHIPFCERLCLYCGCNVVIKKDHSVAVPYLHHLIHEMDLARVAHRRRVTQIHWGGGTPTYLDSNQIELLYHTIRERFEVEDNAEISIEIDPRVTGWGQLQTLRRLGFNRLSMGIQDFDPLVQETVHRLQSYEMTRETFEQARSLEFESINVDLMYGLPFQSTPSFNKTIDLVLRLNPDRIAVFSYAHVPSLKHQQRAIEKNLPSEEEKLNLFIAAIRRFAEAGYEHIGMDHFARPDDPLSVAARDRTLHRNFQGYTTHAGTELLAFGVSSISHVGDTFVQNHRDLPHYEQALAENRFPSFRGYKLTEDDRIRGAVIENILCHNVVVKEEFEKRFGIAFDDYFRDELVQLKGFEADGLVDTSENGTIRVTSTGRVFVRSIAQVFDAFQPQPIASKAV